MKNHSSREQDRPKNYFDRYGGRLTINQIHQRISRLPFTPTQKEYAKRVLERFHHPSSLGITRDEFLRGIEETKKNTQDPLDRKTAERLKKAFGL